ncbi:MAG: M14 family zinc carboxypeptidase, partial [Oscillospiraceae bacterium]
MNNFFQEPPVYNKYIAKIMTLKDKYPFIQIFPIGESVLSRQIFALSIGNTSRVTLMAAAFHGSEWLTTTLLTKFFEDVCNSISTKQPMCDCILNSALSEKGLLVVPMVNPDGVSINLEGVESAKYLQEFVKKISNKGYPWQANANGVDLNHNFDAGFDLLKQIEISNGITKPSPTKYGGQIPHSEPESRAMISLLKLYDILSVYAFHSQGEEIYWRYGEKTPAKSKYVVKLLSDLSGYTPI